MQYFSFFTLALLLLCWNTHASEKVQPKAATSKENEQCKQYSPSGMPGIPGIPGVPGSPGRDGFKGEKGTTGKRGLQGAIGNPGKIGPRGPEGPKGERGENGTMGIPGNSGPTGPKGPKGETGGIGIKGEKGDAANIDPRQLANWKQCAWKEETNMDNGKLKECSFNKLHSNTALKVSYQGNIRVYNSNHACNRWYFTFNGNECNGPMTIDSVLYTGSKFDILQPQSFEGYCENIARGTVKVELWVAICSGYTLGNAYTGWNSVSRIMIEEVPPSQ